MAKRSKAWMPLYVGDYLADTADLSTEEHGAYFLLLMHYWNTGPLPTDHARLANICKLSKYKFTRESSNILKFFKEENGKYFNERMDKEIAKAAEISTTKAESGRKGGLAKAKADAKAHAKAYGKQKPCTTTVRASVDKSTGDKPPDPKAELFKLWVSVCTEAGIPERQARSVLGKQLAAPDRSEKAVFAAVGVTCSEARSDPIAFLMGQLKANPETGKKPDSEIVLVVADSKLPAWLAERGFDISNAPSGMMLPEYRTYLSRKLKEQERAAA